MAAFDPKDAGPNVNKQDQYSTFDDGDKILFECRHCKRRLSSKRNVLEHLHSTHGFSPRKQVRKRYLNDPSVEIPRRTKSRLSTQAPSKVATSTSRNGTHHETHHLPGTSSNTTGIKNINDVLTMAEPCLTSNPGISQSTIDESQNDTTTAVLSDIEDLLEADYSDVDWPSGDGQMLPKTSVIESNNADGTSSGTSDSDASFKSSKGSLQLYNSSSSSDELSEFENNHSSDSASTQNGSISNEDLTDTSSTDFTDSESNSGDHVWHASDSENDALSQQERQGLIILSAFMKHNISASATKYIMQTIKSQLFPDSKVVQSLEFDDIWKLVGETGMTEIHYCPKCSTIFPDDKDIYQCSSERCDGLRYKGPQTNQMKACRQPCLIFIFADTKKQLQALLESPGIWEEIQENKIRIMERSSTDNLQDITDGASYRTLIQEGGFLNFANNLSGIFNTDGVNLYSSSKIELWPIFLAINELSPATRFARDRMLLVGLWQGKGKPPFEKYLTVFSETMNELSENGTKINFDGVDLTVRMAAICATVDLPAKASMLNMTYFNGSEGCITCLEPGKSEAQGKGHAMCYPYRAEPDRYPMRTSDQVKAAMMNSGPAKKDMVNGFKGKSGLISLQSLDFVKGIVPDYMHGVLLGVTKSLMHKWFAPTESKKPYFVGKSLNAISRRLQHMKPPHFLERLPRDLEKHYNNLKATELQAWLLFYGIPCLTGFLPDTYLEHFSWLSEAIYILLGDNITQAALARAEELLDKFYSKFDSLYNKGSCGLNVHNVGMHLIYYVRQWGPIWAWSNFGFEDSNAMLLQSVHGTGNVLRQVMRIRQAKSHFKKGGFEISQNRKWKNTKDVANCALAGAPKQIGATSLEKLLSFPVHLPANTAYKIERILKDDQKFYSGDYERMKKRICNTVLLSDGQVGRVKTFVVVSNLAYAIISLLDKHNENQLTGGKHLIPVSPSGKITMVPVDELVETLLYLHCDPSSRKAYVSRMPNKHGHAVFK